MRGPFNCPNCDRPWGPRDTACPCGAHMTNQEADKAITTNREEFMATDRSGPSVTVKRSCWGCKHCHTESYCVEDGNDCDSGHYVSCAHPHAGPKMKRIGDTSWETPNWCPIAPMETDV